MVYDKTKLHTFIFLTCILLYLVSPSHKFQVPVEQVQAKETQTKTGRTIEWVANNFQTWRWITKETGTIWTGKVLSWRKQERRDFTKDLESKKECNADCKARHLVSIGINERIAYSLVYTCKSSAKDPVNCIKLGASIVTAESGGGKKCHKNNCFWMNAWAIWYDSVEDSVEHWVSKYNKFWFNQKNPSSFYSNSRAWKPKTRYCLSEFQPDWTHLSYCKNWYRHSWSMFNKIQF